MTDNEELFRRLLEKGDNRAEILDDALQVLRNIEVEGATTLLNADNSIDSVLYDVDNFKLARKLSRELRSVAIHSINRYGNAEMPEIIKSSLLFDAPHDFDSYCRFLEWNREPQKKFYEPRRKQLRMVAEDLQRLADNELEILGISLPPGVGKTTLAEFYLTWRAGRNPELTTLGASHSLSLMRGVFAEIMRIIEGNAGEYLWQDVFPNARVCTVNSYDLRLDIGRKKKFETLEFTAVGSKNAGKVRATGLLYCDDLIEGIDVAMNRERLDKLWQIYRDDLRQRKQGAAQELHIATRWSRLDPIGRLSAQYEGNPKVKFIAYPAVDEDGNSNFDYPYGLGFTTDFYAKQQSIMDRPSWEALYMNQPIEREGILYPENELRRYFSMPDREPDAIYAVCDTKNKGDDYCVLVIAYQYGTDYYIDRFVCDNSKPEVIDKRVANALVDNGVMFCQFESNNAGGRIAENVSAMVRELGGFTQITQRWNNAGKDTRIIVASGWIKENCLFREKSLYENDHDYISAMKFLTGYTMCGKMKHDDVPDAMASLYFFLTKAKSNKATIAFRPF